MFLNMDFKALDNALLAIIEKKNQLSSLNYNDKNYDNLEEELHDLEDDFIEKYGDFFEDTLEDIHEKLSVDNEILLPIAYLANKYTEVGKNSDGTPVYDVSAKEGVFVDSDKYPGKDTRLVLMPSPVRFVLLVDGKAKEEVWKAGQ